MLAATKVKMSGSEKTERTGTQTLPPDFLHKTCK